MEETKIRWIPLIGSIAMTVYIFAILIAAFHGESVKNVEYEKFPKVDRSQVSRSAIYTTDSRPEWRLNDVRRVK